MWNCRGIREKKGELEKNIHTYDIAIITEIQTKNTEKLYIKGYNTVKECRVNTKRAAGGVAIFIKENIKAKITKIQNYNKENMEATGVTIKCDKKEITIIGIYRKPGYTDRAGTWSKLIKSNKKKNSEIILAGDFNAHNIIWNCRNTDGNGDRLAEEMENEDMYMLRTRYCSYI